MGHFCSFLRDAVKCMKNVRSVKRGPAHFTFIGDSRIRQLRDGLLYQLTGTEKDWLSNASIKANAADEICKHENQETMLWRVPVRLSFFWAPKLSMATDVIRHIFLQSNSSSVTHKKRSPPDFVVIGCGIWTIQTCIADKITRSQCFYHYKQ